MLCCIDFISRMSVNDVMKNVAIFIIIFYKFFYRNQLCYISIDSLGLVNHFDPIRLTLT